MNNEQDTSEPSLASASSIRFMRDLAASRVWTKQIGELPEAWRDLFYMITTGRNNVAQKDVSKFIDLLKTCDRSYVSSNTNSNTNSNTSSNTSSKQPLADGMYLHPRGSTYKVYHTVHGANQQVAKRLLVKDCPKHGDECLEKIVSFKYEGKSPLNFLKPSMRMSMADAMAFGKLYGTCCICGKTLTNELSIALGIGPVCGKREFGGEYQMMIRSEQLSPSANTRKPVYRPAPSQPDWSDV